MAVKDLISMGIGPTSGVRFFVTLGIGTFEIVAITPRPLTLRPRSNGLTLRERSNRLTLRERSNGLTLRERT